LNKITHIHSCIDISKNKLRNTLNSLFKDDVDWVKFKEEGNFCIKSVKNSYVDSYVKKLRKQNDESLLGIEITKEMIESKLLLLKKETEAVTNL
jgi:hypothetical protein